MFYIFGDMGHYNQSFEKLCRSIKWNIKKNDKILLLGDNFYPIGVLDTKDEQWNFWTRYFIDIDKYAILGNHDYQLDPYAQIEYKDHKWNMPDWFYTVEFKDCQIWFLDTCQMVPHGNLDMPRPNGMGQVTKEEIEKYHKSTLTELANKQLNWLDKSLKKSNKKIKIVVGHYPLVTNGYHKGKQVDDLREMLDPILVANGVKIYMAGHDHNNQHIVRNGINYFVCGSSAAAISSKVPDITNDDWFYAKTASYASLDIINDTVIVSFCDTKGCYKKVEVHYK